MDMKINSALIVSYRKKRAWSQHHLSLVANVSVRTIQRVENEGNASFETLKSIAAAFDTDLNELIKKPSEARKLPKKYGVSLLFLGSFLLSIIVVSSTTAASDIEIQANRISYSKNRAVTKFFDNVRVFIPHQVEFDITAAHSKNTVLDSHSHHLQISSQGTSLVAVDARITSTDKGIIVTASEVKSMNRTSQ